MLQGRPSRLTWLNCLEKASMFGASFAFCSFIHLPSWNSCDHGEAHTTVTPLELGAGATQALLTCLGNYLFECSQVPQSNLTLRETHTDRQNTPVPYHFLQEVHVDTVYMYVTLTPTIPRTLLTTHCNLVGRLPSKLKQLLIETGMSLRHAVRKIPKFESKIR